MTHRVQPSWYSGRRGDDPISFHSTDTDLYRHRHAQHLTMTLLGSAALLWLLAEAVFLFMPAFRGFWVAVQFLCLLVVPPLWLTFTCNLGRYQYVSRWELAATFIPLLTLLLAVLPWTASWIWSVEQVGGRALLGLHGPWMDWYMLAVNITLLAGGMLIARRSVYWFSSNDPMRLLTLVLAVSPLFTDLVYVAVNGAARPQIAPFVPLTALCAGALLWLDARRRRMDAESMQPQPDLLAVMSHEMRALASGIMGVSDILERTSLNSEQLSLLSLVRTSGSTLLHVVNGTLDLAQIEAGRSNIRREAFRIRDCIEHTLENVAAQAIQKRLHLGYVIDPAVPEWISGDAGRLGQILLNLTYNGVKFTDHGGVAVHVALRSDSPDQPMLVFTVSDSGIGIPAESQDRLFAPFSSVHGAGRDEQLGSGLGLMISRRLAQLMGGTLTLQQSSDQGSTFQLELPLQAAGVGIGAHPLPQLHVRMLLCAEDTPTRAMLTWVARQLAIEVVLITRPQDAAMLLATDPQIAMVWAIESANGTLVQDLKPYLRAYVDLPFTVITWPNAHNHGEPAVNLQLYHPISVAALSSALSDTAVQFRASLPDAPAPSEAVLVVDDDMLSREVHTLILQKLGYSVTAVATPQEALDRLHRRDYAIALIDIQLGIADGRDLARLIRNTIDADGRLYLAALSGLSAERYAASYREAGFDAWYMKPLTVELIERLHQDYLRWLQQPRAPALKYDPLLEQAAIDEQSWHEFVSLTGSTPHMLQSYVDQYISDTEQLLAQMRRSLANGDFDRVTRAAHKLKSSSAMFSAYRLADLCQTIDSAASESAQYDEMLHKIELEYQRVRTTLQHHVGRMLQ